MPHILDAKWTLSLLAPSLPRVSQNLGFGGDSIVISLWIASAAEKRPFGFPVTGAEAPHLSSGMQAGKCDVFLM